MNYKKIYALIVVLLITLVGFLMWQKNNRKISYYTTTNDKVIAMMEKEEVTVIDVRTSIEYKSGHIEGAINIPVEKIDETIIDLLPNKDKYYVVYCRSGSRSRDAARKMAKLGYKNVYDLGSIKNWDNELVNENNK